MDSYLEDEFGITFLWDSVHNIFNGYKTSSGNILENKNKRLLMQDVIKSIIPILTLLIITAAHFPYNCTSLGCVNKTSYDGANNDRHLIIKI